MTARSKGNFERFCGHLNRSGSLEYPLTIEPRVFKRDNYMNLEKKIHSLIPEDLLVDSNVAKAVDRLVATPSNPRFWAELANTLTASGANFTPRGLLDAAISRYPAFKQARLARARWAVTAADVEILNTDLTWLNEQNLPAKTTAALALKYAFLTRNMKHLELIVSEQVESVLATADAMPSDALVEACCETADLTSLLKLLEQAARIDASKVRLALCVRKLFGLGKVTEAKKVLEWAATHPDLRDQEALTLRANRLNILKDEKYFLRTLACAGLDPAETREAQVCAISLLSSKVFAKGGPEVDKIVAVYDSIIAADWPASDALIGELISSPGLAERVRENLETISAIQKRTISLPRPQRPILANMSWGNEVHFGPVGDTQKTALIFGNLCYGHKFPISLLDGLLAGVGYNCIFLEDYNALSGSAGYAQLGPSAMASAAVLREELIARNCDHPLVIGASAGGLGALNYGMELGAERIVVFSGGTMGTSEDMNAINDKRVPQLAAAFDKIDPTDNFKRPIRDVLADADAPPPIRMVFPELNHADRVQAEDISSFCNVTLMPIAGQRRHPTIWPFLARSGPEELLN